MPDPVPAPEVKHLWAELETDGAGLPVLAKRYLELGGEFAAWHVDRAFGDSLDGLMVLDLARADRARRARG